MPNEAARVRIKVGVKPYSGSSVQLADVYDTPKGMHVRVWVGRGPLRTFWLREVDPLNERARNLIASVQAADAIAARPGQ